MPFWEVFEKVLFDYYNRTNKNNRFELDNKYLKETYLSIDSLWQKEFNKINRIKIILFSEAPYWGDKQSYIYNEEAAPTPFLDCSTFSYATGSIIYTKRQLIDKLNELGIIVCDVLPYSFNKKKIGFDYNDVDELDYKIFLDKTKDYHLAPKLDIIKENSKGKIKVLFRYGRVLKNSKTILQKELKSKGLIDDITPFHQIKTQYRSIDSEHFKSLIKRLKIQD